LRAEVVAGEGERGKVLRHERETIAAAQHFTDPFSIRDGLQGWIEQHTRLDDPPTKKNRAGIGVEMVGADHGAAERSDFAKAQQPALRIEHEMIPRHRIGPRILQKSPFHPGERAGQVLLVAVEKSTHIASSAGQSAVDCVIHAAIRLDKKPRLRMRAHPRLQFRPCARVLHDMLHVHPLVRDGAHAAPQPAGLAEAGGDDGEFHKGGNI
jgi:hypothetical protein